MSTAPACNEINTTAATTTTSTPPSTTTTNQKQEKALSSPERTFVFVGSGGSNKYNSGDDDVLAYVMSEEFEESAEEEGAACKNSIVGDCCEPGEYEMHNNCSFDEMEQQPGLLQQQDFQAPPLPPPAPPSLSPPPKQKAALRRTTSAPGPGRLARCPICRKRRGGPCGSDVASKHCYRRTGEWMARDQAMSMDCKKVRRTTIRNTSSPLRELQTSTNFFTSIAP